MNTEYIFSMLSFSALPLRKKILFVSLFGVAICSFLVFFWWYAKRNSLVDDAPLPMESNENLSQGTAPGSSDPLDEIRNAQLSDLDSLQSGEVAGNAIRQTGDLDALQTRLGSTSLSVDAQSRDLDSKVSQ